MSFLRALTFLLFFVLNLAIGVTAFAETADPFKGVELEDLTGTFIVTKTAVNLREAPNTNGEKLGKLEQNELVKVVGKAKGTSWYAIVRDNGERGFAYSPVFLRIIDASLKAPLRGLVRLKNGIECKYTLKYETDDENAGDESLKVADYWADVACRVNGKNLSFSAFMFLTEMPWNMSPGGSHQISMELANIAVDYDRVIASVAMWRIDEGVVVFDSLTPKKYTTAKFVEKLDAKTVPSALKSAVEIAISSWNDELWSVIADKGKSVAKPEVRDEDDDADDAGKISDGEDGEKPLPGMEHSGRGEE